MEPRFTQNTTHRGLFQSAIMLVVLLLGISTGTNAQTTNVSPYCNVQHTGMGTLGSCANSWGFHFLRVKLNTIDHSVSCTNSSVTTGSYPYRFWNSGPTTTLSAGGTYTIEMQTASTTYVTGAAAWIDWNQNNTFDASEAILFGVTGSTAPWFSKSFSVPCNALPGKTRVRVRCQYATAFTAAQACANVTYGETMDYEITIANSSNPSANFFLPDTIFAGSPANFINANKDGYISHEWSTSVAGLSTIEATTTHFEYTFPAAGNYQVRLSSTNCSGTATTTKNIVVVNPTVAPTVRFLASRNYIPLAANNPVVSEVVNFFDFSTSGPTGYLWEIYPDQNTKFWFPISGSVISKNMSIFFTDTASYEVCLTASNAIGSSRLCKPAYVVIEYPSNSNKYENAVCIDVRSTRDSGVVYDPGGKDKDYPNTTGTCQFVIDVCDAKELQITIPNTGFNVSFNDYLRVYDGANVGGKLLYQIGNNAALTASQSIIAPSGKATIEFQTDAFNAAAGFAVYWKAILNNDGPIRAGIDVVDRLSNDSIYNCLATREIRFKNATTNTREVDDIQWIFDFDPNIAYPSGFEDFPYNGDEDYPTYVYSAAKTYTVRMVVHSCEGWDTAYRTFHLATTSMKPQVDFTADERILTIGENTMLYNKTIAWCQGTWTISPGDFTLLNGGSLTDQDIQVQFDKAGRYTIKYTADNDNGTASRTRTDYIRVIDYCKPTVGTPLQSISISRVNFDGEEVISGLGSDGYEDNTTLGMPEVYIGGTYNLEVERDQNVDLADRKVWIDFNRDGTFDANELVAADANSTAKVLSVPVTIPDIGSVTPGIARMRVAIAFSGKPFSPCGPIDAGEYEDYNILLRQDDVPPVITMNGADSVYIEVNTPYIDAGATAFDNREGNITPRIITDTLVDVSQTGVYIVNYNVKDGSGIPATTRTRHVFVLADMTPPVITVLGNVVENHEVNTPYIDAGATAIDNPGGKIVDNLILVSNNVDETTLGSYTVVYSITDAFGNITTATRIVNVLDRTAPVINAVGGNPMTVQVGTKFEDPTTVTDNYWANLPYTTAGAVNTAVFGQYKVTYNAVDGSGNAAAPLTRVYEVTDLIPPVLTSRSGSEFMLVDVNDLTFVEPMVTGTDNYFPTVNIIRSGNLDITTLGDYTITYTGTDAAGNTSVYTRTIRVVDRGKPYIIATPANIERWSVFQPYDGVSTWDNYWPPSSFQNVGQGPFTGKVEILTSNVNTAKEGVYQVIYQAIDGSGNVSDPQLRIVYVGPSTTSINNVEWASAINIYPNPNSGSFEVSFDMPVSGEAAIAVTNIIGQTVATYTAADVIDGKLSVNLASAAAGVYFVQVQSNGQVANKKVTITR